MRFEALSSQQDGGRHEGEGAAGLVGVDGELLEPVEENVLDDGAH